METAPVLLPCIEKNDGYTSNYKQYVDTYIFFWFRVVQKINYSY